MIKKIYIGIVVILLIFVVVLSGYTSLYQIQCKNRVYADIQNKLEDYKSANINIISATNHDDNLTGYTVGASGVIFYKDNGGYYALTAYHVVQDTENTTYLIRTKNDPTLSEYEKTHPEFGVFSTEEYYSQFAIGEIVYTCEKSDLAIIYFESTQDLQAAFISSDIPAKGDRVVAIGTDGLNNVRFVETYGKILSDNLSTFHTDDGQLDNKVLKHNAYSVPGFSGGAVFDENIKLVGINIGGATNGFGQFKCGVMIPCDQIQQCINDSKIIEIIN